MTIRKIATGLALGTLFLGTSVLAQEVEAETPVQPAPPCYFRDRPCNTKPHLALGLDLGGGAFEEGQPFGFGAGTGSGVSPGPAWGIRIGFEFTRWLALDAHYIGSMNLINKQYSPAGPARLVTNGALAELRLTLPISYIQPYLFGGVGYYSTSISGTYEARTGTAFHTSAEPGFPMGVGFGFPITERLSIGAEAAYHLFIGENFSENEAIEGGDITSFNAMLRIRL